MAFNPDQFLAETAPDASGFDPDAFLQETEEKSLGGFGKNLWEDVKGTASGIGHLAGSMIENPVDTTVNTAKALPGALVDEGKRIGIGKLFTEGPVAAGNQFREAAYNKPLTTGLDVLPFASAAGKALGIGGNVAKTLDVAAGAQKAVAGADDLATAARTPGLSEIAPGSKIGDPHALFAYRDNFGPGMSERNIYNVYGDPNHPTMQKAGWGSSIDKAKLDELGIPVTGKQTGSKFEPLEDTPTPRPELEPIPKGTVGKSATMGAAEDFANNPPKPETPPPPKSDPLEEVYDYLTSKYGKAAAKPGFIERTGDVLSNFAGDVRGKDIGLRPGQVQSMGQGFKGLEKAEQLMDYANEKGYFEPFLTDASRKAKIKSALETSGKNLGALRDVVSRRGSAPIDQINAAVKEALLKEFGDDAPNEVQKVLAKIEKRLKEDPSFSGVADLATDLNKAKTPAKAMGQHPGPTTEAANIVARMGNDAARALMNPKESELFTNSLRDFGAHKKLEQAVSNSARRSMTGRSGQLGSLTNRLFQSILDSGGYRMSGKFAGALGKTMKSNPDRFRTLPQFFEELGHHADDLIDDTIEGGGAPGMAYGGVVGGEPMQSPPQPVNNYEMPITQTPQGDEKSAVVEHFILMQKDPQYNMAYMQHLREGNGG